jgi:hypothetical protein
VRGWGIKQQFLSPNPYTGYPAKGKKEPMEKKPGIFLTFDFSVSEPLT